MLRLNHGASAQRRRNIQFEIINCCAKQLDMAIEDVSKGEPNNDLPSSSTFPPMLQSAKSTKYS